MDKVKQVVDKVIHPKDHSTTSGTTGTTSSTTHHSGATGTHGTAGPHTSNAANKADPRVDSDLDGSRNAGAAQYGAGGRTTGTGLAGSHDTAGPHSSNMANKVDPRVDSDLDGSRNVGASTYGSGATHNTHGTTGLGSSNTHGTSGIGSSTHASHGTSTAGPHNNDMLNKLDPRVDSDRDGSRNMGAAQYGPGAHQTSSTTHGSTGLGSSTTHGTSGLGSSTTHGTTGLGSSTHATHGTTTTAGPHSSNLANKVDPRVDSDYDGSRNMGAAQYGAGAHQTSNTGFAAQHGPGAHQTTTGSTNAGPHKSNLLNKLDPRVDSDRDGANLGQGNQRY